MTETTERRGNGGDVETGENQQQVFTCFHIPLGIRQTPPDSHIPTAPATVALPKTQKTKTRKESAAARPPLPDLFQNHVVLETLLHFRIIRRLEYALRRFKSLWRPLGGRSAVDCLLEKCASTLRCKQTQDVRKVPPYPKVY